MRLLESLLGILAIAGCAQAPPPEPLSPSDAIQRALPDEAGDPLASALDWSKDVRSPILVETPEDLRALQAICGERDERLNEVAAWLARRGSVGRYENDIDQLTFALRAAGSPYVWPAAWSRDSAASENQEQVALSFARWLTQLEPGNLRRCGLVRVTQAERAIVVAVVATALADLVLPLPTRARVGQWLEFEATLRVPASQAKLILLPPTGEPMAVPTEQAGNRIRARFAAASPGPWLVQLIASADTGPRPMLEAMLFVDVPPSIAGRDRAVPGEQRARPQQTASDALAQMVMAMRQETRRPPLRRDPLLDALAMQHANAMHRGRRIGHDVGDGPTHQRLSAVDFHARLAGENVAHAADATRVHRALWASPSHRSNLLHRGFARWGLGVVQDDDGSLWVCQLFASEN